MNRDDILKKSREDNKTEDEREKRLRLTSGIPVIISFGVAGLALMFAEMVLLETEIISASVRFMFDCVLLVQNVYLLYVLKKKYLIFTSLGWLFILALSVFNLVHEFSSMM